MVGMQTVPKIANILSYCSGWVVVKWFLCVAILKVCVEFVEVVCGVHDVNAHAFITWFDYDGMVISKFA